MSSIGTANLTLSAATLWSAPTTTQYIQFGGAGDPDRRTWLITLTKESTSGIRLPGGAVIQEQGSATVIGTFSKVEAPITTITETITFSLQALGSVLNVEEGKTVESTQASTTAAVESSLSSSSASRPPDTTATLTNAPSKISPTPSGVSNTSSPSATSGSHDSISKGAIAGIAIGCFIAGALIAAVIVWLCAGRKRKGRGSLDQEGSALAFLPREKNAALVKAQSVESGSAVSKAIENALPQPAEDRAISGEVAKLETSVKNHVQSYYHNRSVSPGLLDIDDIHALGNNLPVSTGTLSTFLGNPETRDVALRFVIAWVMISRMDLHSDPDVTLLPPEIARCFHMIANTDGTSRAQGLLLANWRRITAELLHSTYMQHSFSSTDSRNYSIGTALSVLDAILQPYADSRMDNNQRRRNLEEILKRATGFAFTLFAHPSSWIFDWKEEQGVKSGSLCVFPALLQVSDDTGDVIKPPRQFSDAVVRNLDG